MDKKVLKAAAIIFGLLFFMKTIRNFLSQIYRNGVFSIVWFLYNFFVLLFHCYTGFLFRGGTANCKKDLFNLRKFTAKTVCKLYPNRNKIKRQPIYEWLPLTLMWHRDYF